MTWYNMALMLVQLASLFYSYRIMRQHGRKMHEIGAETGFEVGYIRALCDDDETRRMAVAMIQRRPGVPDFIKTAKIRY